MNPEKIIFLHIPKTAGTSLRQLIEKEYPGNECLYLYYPSPYQAEVINHIHEKLPTAKVLYGHVPFGIHQLLGIQGKYIAFLRDPIKRVISFYNHNAREPLMSYYAKIQQGMSLLEMLTSEITPETNNHMVRIITCNDKVGILDDNDVLEQAIENIEKHFYFIGLVERLGESITLLGQKLCWQSTHTIPHLVKDPASNPLQIDAETQLALEKYNRLDLLLYEYISNRFIL
jgi:hypothetical protein